MGARLTRVASERVRHHPARAPSLPTAGPASLQEKGFCILLLHQGSGKASFNNNNKSIIVSLVSKVRYGNWHGRCVPLSTARCKGSCVGWERRTREGTS